MEARIDYLKNARGVYEAMLGLEKYLHQSSIEESLLHLIKLRASQINGCAFCIDMHWKDLRAIGESEQRLYGLDAWEESPYYTDRERAAFLSRTRPTGVDHNLGKCFVLSVETPRTVGCGRRLGHVYASRSRLALFARLTI